MNRYVAAAMMLLSCRATHHHDAVGGVQVAAELEGARTRPAVTFVIRNETNHELLLVDRFLPWGGNAANWGERPVLRLSVRDAQGRPLKAFFPVRELGPDRVTAIPPRSERAGTLILDHYFDEISRKGLPPGGCLVWEYVLAPTNAAPRRYSGIVRFP